MGEWIFVVESNCTDATRENEFNDWYNNIHIQDAMETKIITKAIRYELTEPAEGKGKYLVIYEIESDDIESDMKAHAENMINKKEQGRISDLLKSTSKGMYKKIYSFKKEK